MHNRAPKTAVVSGGAGGLGGALSEALQARGWRVVLIDLDVSQLAEHTHQIPMQCDLTNRAQMDATCDEILHRFACIDLVVYSAGITHIGAFETTSEAAHRHVFDVNYFAAVAMAQAFLPAVRACSGTHLAITSVAGFAPLIHRTAYAASKHAMTGFFSSLRSEERRHGVRVCIAAPSFVATNRGAPGPDASGIARPGQAADGVDYMSPKQAAATILRGWERGHPFVAVGRVARIAWWIHRLAPTIYQKLMERKISGAS